MDEQRRLARMRLRSRRRHHAELRRRAVSLSIGLFALLWVAVFAQMATGHDPALSSSAGAAAKRAAAQRTSRGRGGSAAAAARGSGEQSYALDPVTGEIVQVPQGTGGGSATQPAPVPAPVVTSQS